MVSDSVSHADGAGSNPGMGIAGVDNVCYARCGLVFRKGRKTGDPSGKNGKVETDV